MQDLSVGCNHDLNSGRQLKRWMRRCALCVAALSAVILTSGSGLIGQAPQGNRPNFLLIVTDDQRADTFTREFMPITHAMVADEGIRFERGYVTTPLCCPSRSSILTGMYARNHGVLRNSDPLNQTTFVERLHAVGYRTGLVGKYLNSWDGSARPEFDFWVAMAGGGSRYVDPRLNVDGVWSVHSGYMTHILRDYALEFLQNAPTDQPFTLLFTPNAPHSPFNPAPEHEDLYPDLPAHRPPNFDEEDVSDKPAWVQGMPRLTPMQISTIDDNRRKQLQMLKSVDDAIGEMLTLLRDQGRLDNTFVVFLADNGFFWGEHRIRQGKNRVYEESQRVPFAVRYPPLVTEPRVERRIVANIDIAPTIYALAGLPIPSEVDGWSLVPLLHQSSRRWRDALLIESWPNPPYAAIETRRYVYVENYLANGAIDPELYDLRRDPHQLENLASNPDYAEILENLKARLAQER